MLSTYKVRSRIKGKFAKREVEKADYPEFRRYVYKYYQKGKLVKRRTTKYYWKNKKYKLIWACHYISKRKGHDRNLEFRWTIIRHAKEDEKEVKENLRKKLDALIEKTGYAQKIPQDEQFFYQFTKFFEEPSFEVEHTKQKVMKKIKFEFYDIDQGRVRYEKKLRYP